MTKLIVITLDSCCRINPTTGETLEPFRPSVVTLTEFVENLGLKGIIKGTQAPDEANDADFLKFYTEAGRDAGLAIESYLASFETPEGDASGAGAAALALAASQEQDRQEANRKAVIEEQARLDAEARAQDEENRKKAAAAEAQKEADKKAAAAAAAAAKK